MFETSMTFGGLSLLVIHGVSLCSPTPAKHGQQQSLFLNVCHPIRVEFALNPSHIQHVLCFPGSDPVR